MVIYIYIYQLNQPMVTLWLHVVSPSSISINDIPSTHPRQDFTGLTAAKVAIGSMQ